MSEQFQSKYDLFCQRRFIRLALRNWTLWLDFRIILKTAATLFFRGNTG
jgi:lipopolysaccharide/colanic/teichoic acid biosynthesis glycosyltransferase